MTGSAIVNWRGLCPQASGNGAPLNPYHTHAILVDNGKVAPEAWGAEIQL